MFVVTAREVYLAIILVGFGLAALGLVVWSWVSDVFRRRRRGDRS